MGPVGCIWFVITSPSVTLLGLQADAGVLVTRPVVGLAIWLQVSDSFLRVLDVRLDSSMSSMSLSFGYCLDRLLTTPDLYHYVAVGDRDVAISVFQRRAHDTTARDGFSVPWLTNVSGLEWPELSGL